MKLHTLPKLKNYRRKAKIIGRGTSSGKGGHTVGRGMNGQSSRSGGNQKPRQDFEGGQNPLSKRLPKLRGFKRNYDPNKIVGISLDTVAKIDNKEVINRDILKKLGIVNKSITGLTMIKMLNSREYKGKHSFDGILFSKTAKETVLKSGGSIKE